MQMELELQLEMQLQLQLELGLEYELELQLQLDLKLFAELVVAGASWCAVLGVVDWKLAVEILGRIGSLICVKPLH